MIQSFPNFGAFGDICQFLFRDMGYFSKYLKEYGIPGTPSRASLIRGITTTITGRNIKHLSLKKYWSKVVL